MMKPQFIETMRMEKGEIMNLPFHKQRIEQTIAKHFDTKGNVPLKAPSIPQHLMSKRLVYRVVYNSQIVETHWAEYKMRKIQSLQIVEGNDISYAYKFANREQLNALLNQKQDADEIVITQNGYITDTSFSNLVFQAHDGKLYTPTTFLLNGTKRQLLLLEGVVHEKTISIADLPLYTKVFLINAMLDIEDNVSVDISSIRK